MIGIYDLRNDTWIGNDDGPLSYPDRQLAQVAIQVISDQLFTSDLAHIGKLELREIPEGAYRMRDKLKVKRTAEESLYRLENNLS